MGSEKQSEHLQQKARQTQRLNTFIKSVVAGHARDVRDDLTLSRALHYGAIVFPAPVPNIHLILIELHIKQKTCHQPLHVISMKNIPIQKVVLFTVIAFMIVVVIEKDLFNVNSDALMPASTFSDKDLEEAKSVLWFINHREEAHTQIQECRMDIVLSHTENCVNAEFAIKIIGI
ncbi:MAG: hypothetical protein KGZ88_19955 [Methylomicrobium sp.]|nr:hypothetical protein [Methylomicrobium sp.]